MNKLENLGVSLAGGMTKIGLPVNIWEQPTNETSDMGNTTIVAIRAAINTLLTDNEHQIDPKLKWVLAIYQVVSLSR